MASFKSSLAGVVPELETDLNDEQFDDEDAAEQNYDEDAFVAPHILSARTYTEEDVLKRYRPTRKLSTAMI